MPTEIGGDRKLWKPLDEEVQKIIDRDPRIKQLFDLAVDHAIAPEYLILPSKGILMNCAPDLDQSERAIQRVFGEKGECFFPSDEVYQHSMCPSEYKKTFDDGITQVVGFTRECWESAPGHCWALYGHILPV